jgi:hypothetical protein
MDHQYEASTVEMDRSGFSNLKDQLIGSKAEKAAPKQEKQVAKAETRESNKEASPTSKKYVFRRGDESFELDDDFELEMMADKQPIRLSLRELKDRAAGDVAVKNRMHSLAEERKKIQGTLKQFADIGKNDPIEALKYIVGMASEDDSEFEFDNYVAKLAEQAEKIGQMDEKERKAWELEKKLTKAEQNLSQKEREAAVVRRKQEILSDFPEIGDSEFSQMVDAVMDDEDLIKNVKDEHEFMDTVEELIIETATQRDIMTVIREINPEHVNDQDLIFALSDQLKQNPDLDEEDVRDILGELIAPSKKRRTEEPSEERVQASRVLSRKARESAPVEHLKNQNLSTYDTLALQLKDHHEKNKRTPLYMR